ncbi:hypothetical protein NDR87_03980 [Nocardia sp. CDC159]|uniref:3-hydroxyacyl-[acyl-carrier-protein] dehydratase n=2 Tax=Nocardiaceae TaxID=85025 RepID=A0A9X2E3D9_9NOCA|nr:MULTISPECIES: hypothetical protein [Nocardia]MCM6773179.1 hypothetical protein [Nocardia pulmonis]MCM6785518.1 hypothetical protein [Nocardia sp. CDC159]
MLLVDRVADVYPGRRLTGYVTIRPEMPWYDQGFPPYLVLESWLQSAAALACWGDRRPERSVLVGRLREIGFVRPARAGETVEHRVEIVKAAGGAAICSGTSTVAGTPILRIGQVTVSLNGGQR